MDFQLVDCESTVPSNSAYAKDGDLIGAPIWRSPEAQFRIGWETPLDIWSFGAVVLIAAPSVSFKCNWPFSSAYHLVLWT